MLTQITDPEFIYGSKTQELIISFYHLDIVPGYYSLTEEDLILVDAFKTIQLVVPIFQWEEKTGVKVSSLIEQGKITILDYKEEGDLLIEKPYSIKDLKSYTGKILI